MQITVIGRGNVGGGLAELWRAAGHEVQELGRDGGDASDADVLLVAVPSSAIADALGKVEGIQGKIMIDATNGFRGWNESFESLAHEVKSIVGGPTYAADDDAREVTEQLIRDAGYEPAYAGGLEQARALEDALGLLLALNRAGLGAHFYRHARPGEL